MTREVIDELVRQWVPRLRLTHWELRVDWDKPADEGDEANISPHDSYDLAVLRFTTKFPKWPRYYAEQVVVHELLHLVTRDLEQVAAATRDTMPSSARQLAESAFEHEIEGVIDRVAACFAALAPVTLEG